MTVNFKDMLDISHDWSCTPIWKAEELSVTENTLDECFNTIWSQYERKLRYVYCEHIEIEDKYADDYWNWKCNMSMSDYYGNGTVD